MKEKDEGVADDKPNEVRWDGSQPRGKSGSLLPGGDVSNLRCQRAPDRGEAVQTNDHGEKNVDYEEGT